MRIRPIELRGEPVLSFVYRHATRDVTKNLDPRAARAAVVALLDPAARAVVRARDAARRRRRAAAALQQEGQAGAGAARERPAGDAPARRRQAHDRAKPRALPLELPFWVDLGIADERHRLVPSMARKWKQIDKFLEVLEHALDDAG